MSFFMVRVWFWFGCNIAGFDAAVKFLFKLEQKICSRSGTEFGPVRRVASRPRAQGAGGFNAQARSLSDADNRPALRS
jgi:hypothetical protein